MGDSDFEQRVNTRLAENTSEEARSKIQDDPLYNPLYFLAYRLLVRSGKKLTVENLTKILQATGAEIDEDIIKYIIAEKRYFGLERYAALTINDFGHRQILRKTKDEMLVVLKENSDGQIEITSEENLREAQSKNGRLENLARSIEIISNVTKKYETCEEGNSPEEDKLVIRLLIGDVEKFEGFEPLYRNLSEALLQRMADMKKEKRIFPQTSLDYIEFWTHLTLNNIGRNHGILDIRKADKLKKKMLRLADFLRELYTIVEIKSGVKRQKILSYHKSHKIAQQEHIMMYIIHNKFPFLSSANIGKIFGGLETPKHHATVIMAQRRFKNSSGTPPKHYTRNFSPRKLYKDATSKYEKFEKEDIRAKKK